MKISVSLVRDLTPELYKQLYSLNLRGRGMMRDALVEARRCTDKNSEQYNYEAICLMNGDLVVSWCLFMPSCRPMYARKLAHVNDQSVRHMPVLMDKVVTVMFWTRLVYRKQGYGKKVATFASHHAQKNGFNVCKVGPWDKKSRFLMESLEKTSPLPVME